MHNTTRQAGHETLLREALHHEVADVEPRHLLADILAAARRCEPWLIALLAILQLAVITIALAGLTAPQTTPPPAPTYSQEK